MSLKWKLVIGLVITFGLMYWTGATTTSNLLQIFWGALGFFGGFLVLIICCVVGFLLLSKKKTNNEAEGWLSRLTKVSTDHWSSLAGYGGAGLVVALFGLGASNGLVFLIGVGIAGYAFTVFLKADSWTWPKIAAVAAITMASGHPILWNFGVQVTALGLHYIDDKALYLEGYNNATARKKEIAPIQGIINVASRGGCHTEVSMHNIGVENHQDIVRRPGCKLTFARDAVEKGLETQTILVKVFDYSGGWFSDTYKWKPGVSAKEFIADIPTGHLYRFSVEEGEAAVFVKRRKIVKKGGKAA